jgi:pimeloyl-ACP methyl ester carboxylesterase
MRTRALVIASVLIAGAFSAAAVAAAGSTAGRGAVRTLTGTLPDGATYLLEVPRKWNGTLLLYAHGYNAGPANPAQDVSTLLGQPGLSQEAATLRSALLERRYALAGESYPGLGWQTPAAVTDQIATLTAFKQRVAKPHTVIAWGQSMGGEITALLAERYPHEINGAVPMCPQVAGEVPWFNAYLDAAYTEKTLLAPTAQESLVGIADPGSAGAFWVQLATTAQQSASGRARLALAAAFATEPGWSTIGTARPAAHDYAAQERNQFHTLTGDFAAFATSVRADMENRVGGPFSWNTSVNYAALYRHLDPRWKAEVQGLYRLSGASLPADLTTLNAGPRIAPTNPTAISQMDTYAQLGNPQMPVLTMHTIGDNVVFTSQEAVYRARVQAHHKATLLRQTFVAAPGHCNFTASEQTAALLTMAKRLSSARWPATTPQAMNSRAFATHLDASAFVRYRPAEVPRPGLYPSH